MVDYQRVSKDFLNTNLSYVLVLRFLLSLINQTNLCIKNVPQAFENLIF